MYLNNSLEHELDKNSVCKDSLHTADEGYKTKYYNLNAIISVDFKAIVKEQITKKNIWVLRIVLANQKHRSDKLII